MLRNRKEVTETKLRGVNRAADQMKVKLGTFIETANFIPGKRWKMKKKRGVELLEGDAVTITPEICSVPPAICLDSTIRGQSAVAIELRFEQQVSFPPHGALRTSWGFMDSGETVSTLIGNSTGSGGNMAYNSTDCQRNEYVTPSTLTHPALIDPDGGLPFLNTAVGPSDEPIYGCRSGGNEFKCYYPDSNTSVTYTLPGTVVATSGDGENAFCKIGTSIYFFAHDVGDNTRHILEFTAASGALLNDFDLGYVHATSLLAASATYLYLLGIQASGVAEIRRLSRVDASFVDTVFLDNISPFAVAVVNDNLIYVLCSGDPAAFYYIENFTDLVYIGRTTTGAGFTPFGNENAQFVEGALYYGSNGFGVGAVDIYKTSIDCPDTPIVASMSVLESTVADGNSVTVSWEDVLIPDATDKIWLLPDVPGKLGVIFASIVVARLTDGLGTSSMSYEIPIGTTPGDYFLAYMSENAVYVCKSEVFEVT